MFTNGSSRYDELLAQARGIGPARSRVRARALLPVWPAAALALLAMVSLSALAAGEATADPTAAVAGHGAGQGYALAQAAPEEFQSPRAASYGVFPVEGSGVEGNVQITELSDGGTRFVVTLFRGITEGDRYLPVLFEGDCGPDRPEVRQLTAVGEIPGDPFVSITDTELEFTTITDGEYFLYIFEGDMDGRVLACGEVGVGAVQ